MSKNITDTTKSKRTKLSLAVSLAVLGLSPSPPLAG